MTHPFAERLRQEPLIARRGRVRRIFSTHIEADGPATALGALCRIEARARGGEPRAILAQVIGVERDAVVLAPLEARGATFPDARVTALSEADEVAVGDAFMGRAIDALGRPIDGGPPIVSTRQGRLAGDPVPPLDRMTPKAVLETGVRAIDSLLTLGHGQRVGVFAASGVGKSTLLTQIIQQAQADCCVVCLVGERGREVEALWNHDLSPKARAKTTLVAATSDESAAMRARAGDYALALAEAWRADGRKVLLFIDSVTRLAMALREIGLAAGEPPTVRAYTPNVFAAIPRVVERCGAVKGGGAVTAIMTVLAETDDVDDPISEMMKSLLDGHVLLSRSLAEQGHFPAIDVPRSISRLASGLVADDEARLAREANAALATYDSSRTLIESGVYVRGGSPEIDRAIALRPRLASFLQQARDEHVGRPKARAALAAALRDG